MVISPVKFFDFKGIKAQNAPFRSAPSIAFTSNPIKAGLNQDAFVKNAEKTDKIEKEGVNPVSKEEIYKSSSKFAEYFHEKLKNELVKLDENNIENIIQDVSEESGLEKDEVTKIVARLTQFSNYEKLSTMGSMLVRDRIGGVYNGFNNGYADLKAGPSVNNALYYAGDHRGMFFRSDEKYEKWNDYGRKAFFLDEYGIYWLKKEKETNPKGFKNFVGQLKTGKGKLYAVDGWNVKIGDRYYSYGVFDKNIDLKSLTSAVASKMVNEGCSMDDALNSDIIKDAKEVLGENIDVNILGRISPRSSTKEAVVNNVYQKMPTSDNIKTMLEYLCNRQRYQLNDPAGARVNLMKYFDEMAVAQSADSIPQELKVLHEKIVQKANELGYKEEDILYMVPDPEKSFSFIAYQYMKVNDINPENFFEHSGVKYKPMPEKYKHKCFVVLDDFIGSGSSMILQRFKMEDFYDAHSFADDENNLIIGTIVALKDGTDKIEGRMRDYGRNSDCVITNHMRSWYDFAKDKTNKEMEDLDTNLIHSGFRNCNSSVCFPYQGPDNNSKAGHLFAMYFIPNDSLISEVWDFPWHDAEKLGFNLKGEDE